MISAITTVRMQQHDWFGSIKMFNWYYCGIIVMESQALCILSTAPEVSEHNPGGTIQKLILLDREFLNSALGLCSEIT